MRSLYFWIVLTTRRFIAMTKINPQKLVNPRVIVEPCSWWGRLWGYNYCVYMRYAIKTVSLKRVWIDEHTRWKESFFTFHAAIEYAGHLQANVQGSCPVLAEKIKP